MTVDRRWGIGRRWAVGVVLLAVLALAGAGLVRASGVGAPSAQERADAVSATIRCPTCQGLSIKDSPSVLAGGSRAIVEEQLAQGRTPDEVRQYFVDRYGPFILLSPDPRGPGLLVWLLPVLALPGAAALVWRWARRARASRDRTLGPVALRGGDAEADGDALTALQAFRSGELAPDGSPAGEALREALMVRVAVEQDDVVDDDGLRRAEVRLGAAYRRYLVRETRVSKGSGPSRDLPRRSVAVVTAAVLLLATGTALAMGVRVRGANDLPTGDLPGGAPQQLAAPGLAGLMAATVQRPTDVQAWIALGRAYDRTGQFTETLAAYDKALALQPGSDDVALLRAGVLVRAGSAREALPVLTSLAARFPDNPDTLLLLGLAQDKTGVPAATATLRRFLQLAPDAPTAPGVRSLLARR